MATTSYSSPATPITLTITGGGTAEIFPSTVTTTIQPSGRQPGVVVIYPVSVTRIPGPAVAATGNGGAPSGSSSSTVSSEMSTPAQTAVAPTVVPTATTTIFQQPPAPTLSVIAAATDTYVGPLLAPTTIAVSSKVGEDRIETVFAYVQAVDLYRPSPSPSSSLPSSSAAANGTAQPSSGSGLSRGSSNLTPGEAAGAAIGAAIGAAVIAFLVTFFLCVRKRRNSQRGNVYMTEKPSSAHAWDAFLPQSADDGTIQRSVNALYSQIDMHVENYYGSNAMASISMDSRAALQKVDGGILPRSVEELMRETTTPLPVIKHCFAWMILSRLSPAAHSESSLLPPELARTPPNLSGSKGRSDREAKAMDQAYPYWRVLTAHLLYPRSSNASQNVSAQGATEVLTTLSTAFQPWSKNVKSGASAPEHLSSVIKTATETGLLILSQPSTFTFEWDVLDTARAAPGPASSAVVVLPAFEKTADERGEALAQRYVLAKPKVEAISL